MPEKWIDQLKIKQSLAVFFDQNGSNLNVFGTTVNQTFEAFVFAATIAWYQEDGWSVEFRHPKSYDERGQLREMKQIRLKFSTRGSPNNYSYVVCKKGSKEVHIRHQLRVATKEHGDDLKRPANVCLDVAVIEPRNLTKLSSDDFVPNASLITFGEAKHMSAFAELIANFIGLVHEMQPHRLQGIRVKGKRRKKDLAPFLYVSGLLFITAQGIEETIKRRGFDLDIFCRTKQLAEACQLPELEKPKSLKRGKMAKVKAKTMSEHIDLPF